MAKRKRRFEVGDHVAWRSQAGGVETEKRGEVVLVDPELRRVPLSERCSKWGCWRMNTVALDLSAFYGAAWRADTFCDGIAVLVRRYGKKGTEITPYLYCPRVSKLRKLRRRRKRP